VFLAILSPFFFFFVFFSSPQLCSTFFPLVDYPPFAVRFPQVWLPRVGLLPSLFLLFGMGRTSLLLKKPAFFFPVILATAALLSIDARSARFYAHSLPLPQQFISERILSTLLFRCTVIFTSVHP